MTVSWWYAGRAAGLVAWALLTASVVFGLLLSGKALGKKVRPNWIQDLHRGLAGLAVAFVGVHVASAIADSYVHFGAADVLVPLASGWKPLAVAWGIVSMYLLVAVEASSLLKKHLPRRWWKGIHLASYPLFLTATLHGLTAGPDLGTTVGIGAAALATAAIAGLTTHRVLAELEKKQHPPAPRIPARIPPSAPLAPPAVRPAADPVRQPVGSVPGPF